MTQLKTLDTITAVIETLGGVQAVKELTRSASTQVVRNWITRDHFASDTYVLMTEALGELGYVAPQTLWRQREREVAQ